MLISSVIQSVVVDMIFIFSGSAFSSWNVRMYGPSVGWLSSQLCSFGELCAKSHAESSRNGVVGSMGKNMPISPSVRLMKAMRMSVVLMCCVWLEFDAL